MSVVAEVFVNQAGYRPEDRKVFITNGSGLQFRVVSACDARSVFVGMLSRREGVDRATGMVLASGDFSEMGEEGVYRIEMDDGSSSSDFRIGRDVYHDVARTALRSFYYQRCGVALDRAHVGVFSRPACHTADASYHESTGLQGTLNCTGGWHDAGDYGKYVHATAVALGIMLQMYEQYPECFDSDDIGIPESGNGIPDFLDEMQVGLGWMLKMQVREPGSPLDGGVHLMVNSKDYVWALPDKDEQMRWVYGISSIATADFAASMALAARIFRSRKATQAAAASYLEAALRAWEFLMRHPSVYPEGGFVRPDDTRTGGYFDEVEEQDKDDRLWAAVELAITTGSSSYVTDPGLQDDESLRNAFFDATVFKGTLEWGDVAAFAFVQAVLHPVPGLAEPVRTRLRSLFLERCDTLVACGQLDGFGVIIDRYSWGSNGAILGLAQLLLLGAKVVDRPARYRQTALDQLHYVLGRNAMGMCFVTGVGFRNPRFLHHASMANDEIDRPFPGFLVGGANPELSADNTLPLHFGPETPPALCYVDHVDSWASNENCILYNAPLVAVTHVLSCPAT